MARARFYVTAIDVDRQRITVVIVALICQEIWLDARQFAGFQAITTVGDAALRVADDGRSREIKKGVNTRPRI
jgi:hypothetical protein